MHFPGGRGEVLVEADHHVPQAAGIHAIADLAAADVGAHRQSRLLIAMAKEPVLHHLVRHGPMAAAAVIVVATGGHGRPEGHAAAGAERHCQQPHQVEQQRKLFIGLLGAVERLHRHQAAKPLLQCHQASEQIRLRFGIGVEKYQHLAQAGLHAVVQGPGLTAPAWRQGWWRDHLQGQPTCRRPGDGGCAVAGMVIDHDHLQRLLVLPAQACQKVGQGSGLITGWDQHRNARLALH